MQEGVHAIKYVGNREGFSKFSIDMITAFDKKQKEGKMKDIRLFVVGSVHGVEKFELLFVRRLPNESLERTGVRIGLFKPSILLEPIPHSYFQLVREEALQKVKDSPELRVGQALYIVLHENFPELAESISGTEFDPFEVSDINDERLKKFYYRIVKAPWEE